MTSEEFRAGFKKGYNQGRKDLLTMAEWLHRWYDEHPNSTYEEAEAAFLSAPIKEIFGERKAV